MKTKEVGLPLEYSRAGCWLEVVPIPLGVSLLLVVALVLMNSFFTAAEFAIVKVRIGRLQSMAEQGRVRARFARKIAGSTPAYLSACQLGISLTSLGLGIIGIPALSTLLKPLLRLTGASPAVCGAVGAVIGGVLIAGLLMVLAERLPKGSDAQRIESVGLWTAIPLTVFYRAAQPFIGLLDRLTAILQGRRGISASGAGQEPAHSGEELRHLMKDARNRGMLNKTEFAMVDNIFGFSDTTAREVMIPRTEMVCLYAGMTYQENVAIALDEMLTRYPVCDPDKDNIIGFIHIKDLLRAGNEHGDIRAVIRPLMNVPQTIPISMLLQMMQKRRTHMALLIDEYGGTSGLVTAEDILEEIVGEIQDEFDEERPGIEKTEADAYSVDGLLLIEEVNEQLGLHIHSEDYDTIGGWLYAHLESPPRKAQRLRLGMVELMVEEVDHLRISRILIRQAEEEEEKGETVA